MGREDYRDKWQVVKGIIASQVDRGFEGRNGSTKCVWISLSGEKM